MGPATALATLSSQPDPLALGYSSRDSYFECAGTAGAGDGDRAPPPAVRILHGDHDLGLLVSPGGATPGLSPPTTEHPTQKVIDVEIDARKPRRDPDIFVAGGGAPGLSAAASPGADPRFGVDVRRDLAEVCPQDVVPPAGFRVRKHFVGLRDLLKAPFGGRVFVDIRVIGAGQLAVSPLDFLGRGIASHAQDLIKVLGFRHQAPPRETITAAGRRMFSLVPYPGRTATTTVPSGASATVVPTASSFSGLKGWPTSS